LLVFCRMSQFIIRFADCHSAECRGALTFHSRPVQEEEGHTEAEPDTDKEKFLDGRFKLVVHNFQTYGSKDWYGQNEQFDSQIWQKYWHIYTLGCLPFWTACLFNLPALFCAPLLALALVKVDFLPTNIP